MQRDKKDVVRIFIYIFTTFFVLLGSVYPGVSVVNAVEYKVDRSVMEKYAGDMTIIKSAEKTISILESLVGRKVKNSTSRWSYNLFYPSVKVEVQREEGVAGKPAVKNRGGLELKLIGVVVGRMGSFAIFADKLVKEGERYGEIKVVRVDIDRVVIETRDGLKELIVQ